MGSGIQAFSHDFTIRLFFPWSFLDQILQNMMYWKADKNNSKKAGSGKFYSFLKKNAINYLT